MQQKLFQNSLPQEDGAFRNNIEKEPQNHALNWKNVFMYLQGIFALPAIKFYQM